MDKNLQQVDQIESLDISCLPSHTLSGEVRRRIELRLSSWGLGRLSSDMQLIASELVTNACAATQGSLVRISFVREDDAVCLAVWDASDRLPQVQSVQELDVQDLDLDEKNFDRNGGRGLQIVQQLSTSCGVRETRPCGKWVWSRLSVD